MLYYNCARWQARTHSVMDRRLVERGGCKSVLDTGPKSPINPQSTQPQATRCPARHAPRSLSLPPDPCPASAGQSAVAPPVVTGYKATRRGCWTVSEDIKTQESKLNEVLALTVLLGFYCTYLFFLSIFSAMAFLSLYLHGAVWNVEQSTCVNGLCGVWGVGVSVACIYIYSQARFHYLCLQRMLGFSLSALAASLYYYFESVFSLQV